MTFSLILEVIQYGMDTDTWTELDQKLEAGRHHILTIPVPRCARSVRTTFRFFHSLLSFHSSIRQVFCPTQKLSSWKNCFVLHLSMLNSKLIHPHNTLLKKKNNFIVVVMNVYFRSIWTIFKQEQSDTGFKFKDFQQQQLTWWTEYMFLLMYDAFIYGQYYLLNDKTHNSGW